MLEKARKICENPPILHLNDLFTKVKSAAEEIGLGEIVLQEWDYHLLSSGFTDGAIREKKYHRPGKRNRETDLGYLKKNGDDYTVRSFQVNTFAFSDQKAEMFFEALRKQGLNPGEYRPLGLVFKNSEDIQKENNRTGLYQ